jgi:Rod binding domain-containing protein
MYSPNLDESVRAGLGKISDPDKAAKQVEQVFLGELLKNMLENTDFGKDKMVSSYMPYITGEIAKALSERGIGIHDFLMKSPSFRDMVSENGHSEGAENTVNWQVKDNGKLKIPGGGKISYSYGPVIK